MDQRIGRYGRLGGAWADTIVQCTHPHASANINRMRKYGKDPAAISKLSPERHRVTQLGDTEMPETGALLYNKEPGI